MVRSRLLDIYRVARFAEGDEARVRTKCEARIFRFGDCFEGQRSNLTCTLWIIYSDFFVRLAHCGNLSVRTDRYSRRRQFEILHALQFLFSFFVPTTKK